MAYFNINVNDSINIFHVADLIYWYSWNYNQIHNMFHPLLMVKIINIHTSCNPYEGFLSRHMGQIWFDRTPQLAEWNKWCSLESKIESSWHLVFGPTTNYKCKQKFSLINICVNLMARHLPNFARIRNSTRVWGVESNHLLYQATFLVVIMALNEWVALMVGFILIWTLQIAQTHIVLKYLWKIKKIKKYFFIREFLSLLVFKGI